MSNRNSIGKLIAKAAVFIILEIAALVILSHNAKLQNLWLTRSVHNISAIVWGGTEDIRSYFMLKGENRRLMEENFALSQELRKLTAETDPTIPGKKAVWDTVGNFRYTPASIVVNSFRKQHNFLLVSKGKGDGVQCGDGIITSKGIVGIVDAVSERYCYVKSFASADMIVSARIGKQGAVGPLSWVGTSIKQASLKEIPLHIEFEPGDTVFSSGFSSIFPPDIPLGTVKQSTIVNGATYDIRIDLFESFSDLRYVTIVCNTGRKEIEELSQR